MRPFEDLSRLGRIRRMRGLAQTALDIFGLPDARITFLRQAGNTIFRVNEIRSTQPTGDKLFEPGQYLLRIHQPGYQTGEAISLELEWLRAMRREADLPVPEPVAARDGRLLVQVSQLGIPGERLCSLLRWVKGRRLSSAAQPHHYRAQGKLMSRLHDFSAHWHHLPCPSKRKYDWDGLFLDDSGEGIPASEAWALLPREYLEPFMTVAQKVGQVMTSLGKDPGIYGLIHADLGLDANLLFWRGEARPIDFDDSGYGHYNYDLALALEHCQEDEQLPEYRAALLEGYTQIRPLPDEQVKSMDLFLAGFCVFLSLWAAGVAHLHPQHRPELELRMERAFKMAVRLMEKY